MQQYQEATDEAVVEEESSGPCVYESVNLLQQASSVLQGRALYHDDTQYDVHDNVYAGSGLGEDAYVYTSFSPSRPSRGEVHLEEGKGVAGCQLEVVPAVEATPVHSVSTDHHSSRNQALASEGRSGPTELQQVEFTPAQSQECARSSSPNSRWKLLQQKLLPSRSSPQETLLSKHRNRNTRNAHSQDPDDFLPYLHERLAWNAVKDSHVKEIEVALRHVWYREEEEIHAAIKLLNEERSFRKKRCAALQNHIDKLDEIKQQVLCGKYSSVSSDIPGIPYFPVQQQSPHPREGKIHSHAKKEISKTQITATDAHGQQRVEVSSATPPPPQHDSLDESARLGSGKRRGQRHQPSDLPKGVICGPLVGTDLSPIAHNPRYATRSLVAVIGNNDHHHRGKANSFQRKGVSDSGRYWKEAAGAGGPLPFSARVGAKR